MKNINIDLSQRSIVQYILHIMIYFLIIKEEMIIYNMC
jgi:hypothetical protein